MDKKKKKNNKMATIFMLVILGAILVCLCVWVVQRLEKGKNGYLGEGNAEARSEAQKLIDKNLDDSYPATEREVVKIYCRIQQEIYSGECSEEDVQKLFKQMRKLYDEELLAENSYDKQYKGLMDEVKKYKKNKIKITSYHILDESGEVEKGTYEGKEQALVDVGFKTKENDDRQSHVQEFVLRKDDDGRWKILGWYKVDAETGEKDE